MENAVNLAQAKAIWEATNNTLGMVSCPSVLMYCFLYAHQNHMIASAVDVKSMSGSHPAYALETMKVQPRNITATLISVARDTQHTSRTTIQERRLCTIPTLIRDKRPDLDFLCQTLSGGESA